jgi:hypothetical protein
LGLALPFLPDKAENRQLGSQGKTYRFFLGELDWGRLEIRQEWWFLSVSLAEEIRLTACRFAKSGIGLGMVKFIWNDVLVKGFVVVYWECEG